MSINTSNLVTTTNGQSELAKVHSVNYALNMDGREIHVEFLFPYIAISKKSPEEVTIITSSTDSEVKSEPCWSNVDICQVQTYSVLETIKRNFTIGALFDVKEDIEGAKTVVLFAKTIIVDNRSKARIDKDSHRSAKDIVLNNYGYETKMLPYAYTMLLDETGNYSETGIKIGAARFGRSRHRFYFNYIIDNNDGIADNITVDDNVYPYSDGYLSKTAFELGLERYEKAVSEYVAEYNKYANGRNVHYENLEGAITNAVNGHKFYLEQDEADDGFFPELDLTAESPIYGWGEWATTRLEQDIDDEIYDGFVPKNFDPNATYQDGDASNIQRGMLFTNEDVKCVEYTDVLGNVSDKYVRMKANCLMMVRTSLPPLQRMFTTSLYNFARIVVQLFVKDLGTFDFGFELSSSQGFDIRPEKGLFFIPQMPSIGKIKVKESLVNGKLKLNVSTLIMTNDVRSEIAYYNSSIGDGNGNWFKGLITIRNVNVVTGLTDMGVAPSMENLEVSILKRGECYRPVIDEQVVYPTLNGNPVERKDVSCPGLSYKLQPNFAGGYGFQLKDGDSAHKNFLLSKEFTREEVLECDNFSVANSELSPSTTFVINDISHTLMSYMPEGVTGTAPSDWLMYAIDGKKVIKTDLPAEHYLPKAGLIMNLDSKMYYTLISESRLHNARVLIAEKREENAFYRAINSSTEVYIVIIANSNVYKLSLTYGRLLGESVTVANVSNVEVVSLSLRENFSSGNGTSPVFKIGMKVRMGDGTNFTETFVTRYICQSTQGTEESDTPNEVNAQTRPSRYVAVQDISGATNVIKETLAV